MKINLSFVKWWQLLIIVFLIIFILYILNYDKKPFAFVGLDDDKNGFAQTIMKNDKYNKLVKYKCEEICRTTLQDYYKLSFKKARPGWLVNPQTGKCLELDCYNDTLKIACEYNGEQHYVFPNRWFKYKWEFNKQLERDLLKQQICKTQGVLLITVPYTIPNNEIPTFIINYLKQNGK